MNSTGCDEFKSKGQSVNDINAAAGGNTDFAFVLYGKLKNESNTSKNLSFSPYSISTALAIVYGGAGGETRKQMATALHWTLPGESLHSAFGSLQKQLIQEDKTRGYQLLLANALWGQKGEQFLKGFLELAQSYYGAGLELLDFINEKEQSRQKINLWIEERTEGKIKEVIPPVGVDEGTMLVITNAIYFKGEWKTQFVKEFTIQAEFAISAQEHVLVAMMYVKKEFKYYEDEKMQVLELPYKGNEISMLVFLPQDREGLSQVENTLTAEGLNVLLPKMQTAKITVHLPKFKMDSGTFSMKNTLGELGMPDAFEAGSADFSGINGKRDLWISEVFHKAFIEVDEEGTEAAAATADMFTLSSSSDTFCADHPFMFIIRDNRSGSILFMGRVMNPAE